MRHVLALEAYGVQIRRLEPPRNRGCIGKGDDAHDTVAVIIKGDIAPRKRRAVADER